MNDIPNIPEFLKQITIYAVTELTSRIKNLLTSDPGLQHIAVKGEISNFTRSQAGHIYFSLKDSSSQIRCVSFRSRAENLAYKPKEGDEVIVFGSVDVYPQGGSYQLYVDEVFHAGRGELFARYLELKEQLEKEGLFDVKRRKPIPEFPHTIGVVTSARGAAVRDIIKILTRRAPHVKIVISPSLVQGNEASSQIIKALDELLKIFPVPDTVILARGGGSFEDLFCFNSEDLVRYLAEYPIPVITGVGHETDFTLVDFVSDHRSPTPTAAAHDSVPDRDLLLDEIKNLVKTWDEFLSEGIKGYRELVGQIMLKPVFMRPERKWSMFYQELDQIRDRVSRAVSNRIYTARTEIENLISIMDHTNPLKLLKKGYAIVYRLPDGTIIKNAGILAEGDKVRVKVSEGQFTAKVENTETDNGQEKR